ncbi:B3 domain-containing protein [Cardamine amara subsp. amara]|uniref:B3 domain-containing protein n=1 Tax=Cardamine amara subsp. amara TaxID=228776 RepID=A0ABD0ZVY1_CARAN
MVTNIGFGQIMDEADNAGFFKILRPEDLSSEVMRGIPCHFIKSISEKDFSTKMVLKSSWGSSWSIKISSNASFYYMEKSGWDKFLSNNGLGNNEFLTFTHKGNMCFTVDIYQVDTMELLKPCKSTTIASCSCRNKREQGKKFYKDVEMEEIESSSEAETSSRVPEFFLTIKKSYLLFLGIPKLFQDMHMPNETTMFKLHDPKGNKSWEVMYKINGTQSRFAAGWIRLAKELPLVIGDVCTFKLIKPTEMLLNVSRKRTKR